VARPFGCTLNPTATSYGNKRSPRTFEAFVKAELGEFVGLGRAVIRNNLLSGSFIPEGDRDALFDSVGKTLMYQGQVEENGNASLRRFPVLIKDGFSPVYFVGGGTEEPIQ
jgi:hypothetical protein